MHAMIASLTLAMTDYSLLTLGVVLIYGAGVITGWQLARRITGYMLGGRP